MITNFHYITNFFVHKMDSRNQEFKYALEKNIENPLIEEIHLFFEGYYSELVESMPYLVHPKVRIIPIVERKSFGALIEYANEMLPNKMIIVGNSDIWYDETLNLIEQLDMSNIIISLTRYERIQGYTMHDWSGCCHDTLIFKSPVRKFEWDCMMGLLGVDSMLHINILKAGFNLICPCLDIKSYHEHSDLDHNSPTRNNKMPDGFCYWYHPDWWDYRLYPTHLHDSRKDNWEQRPK